MIFNHEEDLICAATASIPFPHQSTTALPTGTLEQIIAQKKQLIEESKKNPADEEVVGSDPNS